MGKGEEDQDELDHSLPTLFKAVTPHFTPSQAPDSWELSCGKVLQVLETSALLICLLSQLLFLFPTLLFLIPVRHYAYL